MRSYETLDFVANFKIYCRFLYVNRATLKHTLCTAAIITNYIHVLKLMSVYEKKEHC